MKLYSLGAQSFYESNFTELPSDVGEEKDIDSPNKYLLLQNYPNPFNPLTNIKFQIADYGLVTLKVYDILGRETSTLMNEELPAGNYQINFNASHLATGVYFYQLRAGNYTETKKMILIK
ncbi:MAG: T9SS type A sorting domain-containing protein [bacterium]|nr:T9SS type A sorting domain-containing protein [bacterium]